MKALRTKTPSELDNPKRWHNYLKPWFDVEAFQQRINDRVGLNRDGRPIVRLIWGQDAVQHVFNETTPAYWWRRLKKGEGYTWWTIPRWIYERRVEPEQYVSAWNEKRYSIKDPTTGASIECEDCGSRAEPKLIGGNLYCQRCASTNISGGTVIDKGPPPSEYYVYMMDASEHESAVNPLDGWSACCTRKFYEDRSRCWGKYRPPGNIDLVALEKAVEAMNVQPHFDPYAPVSAEQLELMEQARNKQIERAQELMENMEREMFRNFLAIYPYPGYVLGGSHFADLGPSFAKGKESGIILTDS
jgi:hypothetical protein